MKSGKCKLMAKCSPESWPWTDGQSGLKVTSEEFVTLMAQM